MPGLLNRLLDTQKIFVVQAQQYANYILIDAQNIGANTRVEVQVNISSLGNFLCEFVTGRYTRKTIFDPGPPVVLADSGACQIRGKISDPDKSIDIFGDLIPLDLWLTPGGVRSPGVLTDIDGAALPVPSNQLFMPMKLDYLFRMNSQIVVELANDSDTEQDVQIMFAGTRILTPKASSKFANA